MSDQQTTQEDMRRAIGNWHQQAHPPGGLKPSPRQLAEHVLAYACVRTAPRAAEESERAAQDGHHTFNTRVAMRGRAATMELSCAAPRMGAAPSDSFVSQGPSAAPRG